MLKVAIRNTLGICGLLLVLSAVAAPAAGQSEPAAPQSPKAESKIWGWWPLVPWDGQTVKASAWAKVLNEPIDLTRKGTAGDKLRYQIKRINLTVDREGKILNRMVAEGRLSRTLLREAEPGIWVERCVWEKYAAAQGMGPNDYPVPQELLGDKSLSFEFSPRTFDYINPPVDFKSLGNEVFGYLLKVLTMDATGWDAVLLSLREEFGGKVRIGDISRQVDWQPWDISRVGGEGSVGQYHVGEMQLSVIGLTRFQGEPCVLIWISMEGNRVTQKMDTPQVALNMKSTEYFRGEIAASLLDGRLVGMELWGPLPCVMEMGFGGQPPKEQPIGAIIQQVSMWEIPAASKKD
ncbi:MAG: hypothetical protein A2Y75_08165 [Candidatus Solincola sediminis]|uniref:Uncharacterized protein n=1 Tax=Candidatus Solincola sediminis TaxID=1797199 RepID=A0A1F2WL75_9ACTN|nr:MAG: hypothetical protein A2Y75_08165 [Candidatus Solincola sediminis]